MTDAMQTIRTFLLKMISIGVYGSRTAITALDSLDVEPSEDARKHGERISTVFGVSRPQVSADPGNDPALDSVTALIQARDERIRRESLEKVAGLNEIINVCIKTLEIDGMLETANIVRKERSAILTSEATDGQ